MSGHFYLPFASLFSAYIVFGAGLAQRYPRLWRPIGVVAGLLLATMGIAAPLLFPGQAAPGLFHWPALISGALLTLGSALDWLSTEPDETPMRPAAGRPPRHFGETS
jgi:hypothetical protein